MTVTTMTTTEIGATLVDLCRQGRNHDAMQTLYADDIVSLEAFAPDGMSVETKGKDAVMAKGQWWSDNHDVHAATVNGPWPNGDEFAVYMHYDVTFKPSGKRFPMEETAIYTVRDGKIVHEKFYYRVDA